MIAKEARKLVNALHQAEDNISEVARILNVACSTLVYRIKKCRLV